MSELQKCLALRPQGAEGTYQLACTLARLNRPFSAGRLYLDRLLAGPGRARYLARIQEEALLLVWRRDPAFLRWLTAQAS